jgi:hypothetical protein
VTGGALMIALAATPASSAQATQQSVQQITQQSAPVAAEAAPSAAAPAAGAEDLSSLSLPELLERIAAERRALQEQRQKIDAQEARLNRLQDTLEQQMRRSGMAVPSGAAPAQAVAQALPSGTTPPVPEVGAKPPDAGQAPHVAVLADQGGILSRPGRFVIEPTFEYTRDDRNRFIFRGIEIPQSVLVGVFDINESRQDLVTAAAVARYGVSSRLEVTARVPYVYRSDGAVLVPLVQNTPGNTNVGTVNTSSHGSGLGDVEGQIRYQVNNGRGGWPYIIAGVQMIAPTGTSPFKLPRDALGNATKSPTGAGFWAVAPSVTLLMPTDPATIFGVLGYTYNFERNVDTRISNAQIDRVKPGGAPSATVGLGLALNDRLSVSFGYAHTVQLGTRSRIRPITIQNGIETTGDPITSKTRDQQIGRLLFGMSYRVTDRTTIDWLVEVGATQDAPGVRTSIRIPFGIR